MSNLTDMIWVEYRKAICSRMPLWTTLGALFMPMGIGFLIFVAKNPEISRKLGLISAKADLLAYSSTDWATYLGLFSQLMAAGGFILFVLITSWIFGREFVDGTLKDMLATPVHRASILLAKYLVMGVWCAGLTLVILTLSLVMGSVMYLPGADLSVFMRGCLSVLISACLTIMTVTPFALFASVGRGYLLPVGIAVLALMMANLAMIAGWGEYYPWAIPGIYAQGKSALAPVSFGLVMITSLAGMTTTYYWWKFADQSR